MAALNISVIASSDDAEEFNAPASPSLISHDLDFIQPIDAYIGIRFQSVTIPPGSTINSAVIRMTANLTYTGTGATYTISCHDTDDAPTFTTDSGNLSTRTKTTASVLWAPGATTSGNQYDTADFTAALQEVIDRPGWASGQDIAVIFQGQDSGKDKRDYWAFDHGSDVPQIRITYTEFLAGYALVF